MTRCSRTTRSSPNRRCSLVQRSDGARSSSSSSPPRSPSKNPIGPMKFCLTLAATVLLGAISLEARAQQPWLSDRRYGEGIGVRVGNLELHPGIAAEAGYDSNYF